MELFILLVLSFCCCQAKPLEGQEVDCDDPEVFNAVDLALQAYNDKTDGNQFALVQILEARKTAGPSTNLLVKYRLKETTCAVGHGRWQECGYGSEADSGHCIAQVHIDNYPTVSQICSILRAPEKVIVSHAQCLGCWESIRNDSLVLQPIVRYAIRQFNNQSDQPSHFEVGEIRNAQSQVVSGWKYKFEHSIKETNCSKAEFPDLTPACKPIPGGRVGLCEVTAYIDISNTLVYAVQDCRLQDIVPQHCSGCQQQIATDNPDLLKALETTLEKYNTESNDDFFYKIKEITAATSQVVAGVNYRADFIIIRTNCSKADFQKLSKNCTAAEPRKLLNCRSTIYVRAWESQIFPRVTCTKIIQNKTTNLTENGSLTPARLSQRYIAGLTPFRKARQAGNPPVLFPESKHRPGGGHSHGHRPGHSQGHGHKHGHKKQKNRSSEESHEDVTTQEETLLVPVTEVPITPSTLKPIPPEEDPKINPNETLPGFPEFPDPLQDSPGSSPDSPLFDLLPDLPEPPAATCPGKLWKPIKVLTPPDEVSPTSQAFEDFDLADALS